MKQTAEQIREEEFIKFKNSVNKFYKARENRSFEEFKAKIEAGEIDPDAPNYKELARKEAESFLGTRSKELLIHIKKYVNDRADNLIDLVGEGKLPKKNAKICFEVLKYVLLAAEDDAQKK